MNLPTPDSLGLVYDEWRPEQTKAIRWLYEDDWFDNEAAPPVKVLEAPTGVGKTGIVLGAALKDITEWREGSRWLILCSTKAEQDQYMNNLGELALDEGWVSSIRGKNNYHCLAEEVVSDNQKGECNDPNCLLTHADQAACTMGAVRPSKCEFNSFDDPCPYYKAVGRAKQASIVVTNYAYGLRALGSVSMLGEFDVVVCDEAHRLNEEIENFVNVRVSKALSRELGVLPLPETTTLPAWKRWAGEHLSTVLGASRDTSLPMSMKFRASSLATGMMRLKSVNEWVADHYPKYVRLSPIWLRGEFDETLLEHTDKVIIMSGTMGDKNHLSRQLGVSRQRMRFMRLPYAFDPENRPIVLTEAGDMSRKKQQEGLPKVIRELDEWLSEWNDVNVLVHAATYKLVREIVRGSVHWQRMVWHESAGGRAASLRTFRDELDARNVLVSPSMTQAVDLPGDECGLVIVLKTPYPYLGTEVMKKRVRDWNYYTAETMLTFRQMIGRGVRNDEDYCPVVVLDSGMVGFLKRGRKHMTRDLRESVVAGVELLPDSRETVRELLDTRRR